MTREEHVEWCKTRARAYLASGDIAYAVTSMMSDMDKRDDTRVPAALIMFGMMAVANHDERDAKRFIEGFN